MGLYIKHNKKFCQLNSEGFWRWCMTLRITVILDIFHLPVLERTERFGNWICFRPQMRGWETPNLLGPLERANPNHWTTYVSKVLHENIQINPMHCCSWTWFVAFNFHVIFYLSFTSVHALSQFYWTFSCYIPLTNLDLRYKCSCSLLTYVVHWLGSALSNGPNRVVSNPHIWGRKRIQFPKRYVL
jgi:hypothetical protein